VVDALEDEDNEWITGIEPTEVDVVEEGETSQRNAVAAPLEETRRRNNKRKRLIPTATDDEELSVPSSDGEDDTDMASPSYLSSDSDTEAQSDLGHVC